MNVSNMLFFLLVVGSSQAVLEKPNATNWWPEGLVFWPIAVLLRSSDADGHQQHVVLVIKFEASTCMAYALIF